MKVLLRKSLLHQQETLISVHPYNHIIIANSSFMGWLPAINRVLDLAKFYPILSSQTNKLAKPKNIEFEFQINRFLLQV